MSNMNKIAEFFSKWAFAMFLGIVAVMLLFAVGCCVYTAVVNPFVGIVGIVGVAVCLVCVVGWLCKEIKEG